VATEEWRSHTLEASSDVSSKVGGAKNKDWCDRRNDSEVEIVSLI